MESLVLALLILLGYMTMAIILMIAKIRGDWLMKKYNRKQKQRERNSGYRKHITENRKESMRCYFATYFSLR